MGWGKKPAGAKPQPVDHGRDRVIAPRGMHYGPREDLTPEIHEPVTGFDREPYVSDAAPKEKPSDAAKAKIAWHKLKSQKGWTDATQAMLLYEFIDSRELFADLIKFTRKR